VARVVATLDRDERLAFLSMDAPEGARWLEPLPEDLHRTTSLLVLPDGRYLHGAESLAALSGLVPAFRPFAEVMRRFGLETRVNELERLVARNRARLGKLVPNVPPPRRFP
jgi:predicted DCC family thiol-disulfide oxidoreductase YuxK